MESLPGRVNQIVARDKLGQVRLPARDRPDEEYMLCAQLKQIMVDV